MHAVGHGHAEVGPAGAEDQLHPQLRTSCSCSCGGGLEQQAHGLVARGAGLRLQRQPQPGQHQRVVEVGPELGQKENVNSYYSGGNRYIYLEYLSGQLFKVVRGTKCSVNSAYSWVMWCAGTRGHFTIILSGDIFRDTGVKQVTKDFLSQIFIGSDTL